MHPGSVSSAAERIAFDEIENYSRPADRFSLAFMRLPIACLNGLFLFGRRSLYTRGWNGDIYICPYYNIDAILFIWCNKLQAHKYEIGLAREKRRNSESECRENGKIGSWSVFGSQMCVDTMCSAHCWHFDGKMAIECSEELQCSWFKDSCFSGFFRPLRHDITTSKNNDLFRATEPRMVLYCTTTSNQTHCLLFTCGNVPDTIYCQ